MGKWVANEVLDGALSVIASATRMIALTGQPASYGAAMAGRLAEANMAPSDFVVASGDVSGRKISVAPKNDVAVTTAGSADHVALVDTAAERLLYVTTCPPQALTAGGSVNFAGWAVEIGAPV
jgi:hypothetical protein